MDKLRNFIQWFVTITTGTLFLCALSSTLSGEETVPVAMLWQALLTGALCALSTLLFFPTESKSRLHTVVGISLHFLSLCAIMIFCGVRFGWIAWDLPSVCYMVGCVIAVYAFTTGVSYLIEKKQVDLMNRILKEKYPEA